MDPGKLRPIYYRLDENKKVIPVEDFISLYGGEDIENRIVAKTDVSFFGFFPLHVSTVFLMIDHSFNLGGPPKVFETMIFKEDGTDDYQQRYSTWDEAVAGHEVACQYAQRRFFWYCLDRIVINPVKRLGLYLKGKFKR